MLKSIAEEVTVLMAANNIIKTEEIEAYTYGRLNAEPCKCQ